MQSTWLDCEFSAEVCSKPQVYFTVLIGPLWLKSSILCHIHARVVDRNSEQCEKTLRLTWRQVHLLPASRYLLAFLTSVGLRRPETSQEGLVLVERPLPATQCQGKIPVETAA